MFTSCMLEYGTRIWRYLLRKYKLYGMKIHYKIVLIHDNDNENYSHINIE